MKKGFTLVELLSVIIILGLLTIIAIPSIIGILNNEKENISDSMKNVIINASSLYIEDNSGVYPKVNNNVYCIKLESLVNDNRLSKPLKDPVTNKEIDLNKYVKVSIINDLYNYDIVDICTEYK